jgi:hypothetical protein
VAGCGADALELGFRIHLLAHELEQQAIVSSQNGSHRATCHHAASVPSAAGIPIAPEAISVCWTKLAAA